MNELLPLIVGSDSRPLKEEDAFGSSAETGAPRPGSGISACSSSVSTPQPSPSAVRSGLSQRHAWVWGPGMGARVEGVYVTSTGLASSMHQRVVQSPTPRVRHSTLACPAAAAAAAATGGSVVASGGDLTCAPAWPLRSSRLHGAQSKQIKESTRDGHRAVGPGRPACCRSSTTSSCPCNPNLLLLHWPAKAHANMFTTALVRSVDAADAVASTGDRLRHRQRAAGAIDAARLANLAGAPESASLHSCQEEPSPGTSNRRHGAQRGPRYVYGYTVEVS
ncbi:hypothetical protein Purlil1_8502 [Purpureocillium lilacinum]|uniref:Uncharacterized protein n=1 Tax=Purpureocillium lilacinum TaxID=33203 RepID=A0ABR0BT14_PURLI|nr:hypothetical protein Purlil1_8502 [Purpureocillium lilacinum]